MRRMMLGLALVLAAGTMPAPAAAKPRGSHAAAPAAADIAAAVSAPGRPEEQTKLDESRRPIEVLCANAGRGLGRAGPSRCCSSRG